MRSVIWSRLMKYRQGSYSEFDMGNYMHNSLIRTFQAGKRVRDAIENDDVSFAAYTKLQGAAKMLLWSCRFKNISRSARAMQAILRRQSDRAKFIALHVESYLASVLIRQKIRRVFCDRRLNCIIIQSIVRMRVLDSVSKLRSEKCRLRFRRAYMTHKNAIMIEIRKRRLLVQRIQGAIRRNLNQKGYAAEVLLFREHQASEQRRRASALLLSCRSRATLRHRDLQSLACCLCSLRRVILARSQRDGYAELHSSAVAIGCRLRAISAQMGASLALRLPLLRLVQAVRARSGLPADAAAARLQSWCRVWCMEALGQPSTTPDLGPGAGGLGAGPRLHLSHRQKAAAAAALQGAVRRLFASSRGLIASGYGAVLDAGALLQARARALRVRIALRDIIRRFSAMVAQAAARMCRPRAEYTAVHAAGRTLTLAALRTLRARHYGLVEGARLQLQAVARMRSVTPAPLHYSRLPTRALAQLLQARIRMHAHRASFRARCAAARPVQALARRAVYRLLYLTTRVWCRKTGQAADLDVLFSRLTSTGPRGGPLWRTADYLSCRRGVARAAAQRWKSAGPVPPDPVPPDPAAAGQPWAGATTIRERLQLREREREEAVLRRQAEDDEARRAGVLLSVRVPTGSGEVLHEGRLSRALGPLEVVLDPTRAADTGGEYINFFLRVAGCGQPRRIVAYGPGRCAAVWPPLEARPFADAAYRVEDLEPAPVSPDLDRLLRDRAEAMACRIQGLVRTARARREVAALRHARDQTRRSRARMEAARRAEDAERDAARRQRREQEEARQAALAAARQRLLQVNAETELVVRQHQTQRQAQLDRLYNLRGSVSEQREAPIRAGLGGKMEAAIDTPRQPEVKGGKALPGQSDTSSSFRDARRKDVYYADSAKAAAAHDTGTTRYQRVMPHEAGVAQVGAMDECLTPTPPPQGTSRSRRGFRRQISAVTGGPPAPAVGMEGHLMARGMQEHFPSPDKMRQQIDSEVHALYLSEGPDPFTAAAVKHITA